MQGKFKHLGQKINRGHVDLFKNKKIKKITQTIINGNLQITIT